MNDDGDDGIYESLIRRETLSVAVDDETPGPIPRGDQAGGASAPGEGARS